VILSNQFHSINFFSVTVSQVVFSVLDLKLISLILDFSKLSNSLFTIAISFFNSASSESNKVLFSKSDGFKSLIFFSTSIICSFTSFILALYILDQASF